jgi:hypothetical protein
MAEIAEKTAVPLSTVKYWCAKSEADQPKPVGSVLAEEVERLAAEPKPDLDVSGLGPEELTTEIETWGKLLADEISSIGETIDPDERAKVIGSAVKISKHRADLFVYRNRATPPVPPDPNADPANVQARDLTRARLMHEIEVVEAKNQKTPPPPAARGAAA